MSQTPEHAIRDWLANFQGTWYPPGTEPSRMLPETVRFVKNRDLPAGQMWFITCEADGGSRGSERWRWTVEASQDERGRWSANGIAGGSGPPPLRGHRRTSAGTGDSAGSGPAARSRTRGAEITSVRLTDVEGRTFEDTVENGVVLFSSDELVTMPMRLDLIDAEGRIVHTEEWGFADE
jgi:hypothetical protein